MVQLPKWPSYSPEEISQVVSVLLSGNVNYWTGNQTKYFEQDFSNYVGCEFSLAIANGSLALSAAYLALGIGEGDEIITTPRTFIATASSAVLLGAVPIFADVDRVSGCITAQTIEPLITPRTKAISVVHIGGWPADMIQICELAKTYNLSVIEDCSQAHGAEILVNDRWVSVGSFGDLGTWSFCQDKIMTTGGEGGMITTSNASLMSRIWSLRDHGKSFEKSNQFCQEPGFRWLHDDFGSNFRITEMQSSIGRFQLKNLHKSIERRSINSAIMTDSLLNCPNIRIPKVPENLHHAWYRLYGYIDKDSLSSGWSRKRIVHEISNSGFPGLTGTCGEIYLENCFKFRKISPANCLPVAHELSETSLAFLVHPTITEPIMQEYSDQVFNVLRKAQR